MNESNPQPTDEREQAFQTTFELAPSGIAHVAIDGTWLRVNPAVCKITGYSQAELVKKTFADITHPEDLALDLAQAERLSRGEIASYSLEKRYLRPSGESVWVEITVSLKRKPDGSADYFIVCIQDISALRLREHQLRLNEEFLSHLIDSIPHMVWVVDVQGQLLRVNRRYEEYTGYSFEELKHNVWSHVLHPEDLERGRERWLHAVESGGQYLNEARMRRSDGEYRWHMARAVLLRGEDGTRRWFGTNTDIHEEKIKTEELQRSNAELAHFAYVASHDLKEPLRMVSLFSQLLADNYRGKLDETADRYVGFITEGTGRMYALIDDLLRYSRLGAGQSRLESFPAEESVAIAVEQLRASIEESGAEIRIGALPVVSAERILLVQLFQNLLSNAIKYRSPKPLVVEIGGTARANDWMFWVKDNGIGIAPEYHEKIFMLFQRLHVREQYPGTGIGLAICRKVVERHGGKIWVESTGNHGSAFWFTLPRPGV